MRAFRFRLARILHLREAEKRQRAMELARKRQKFDAEQQALRSELERRDAVIESYRDLRTRPATAASWSGARDALKLSEQRVSRQATATKAALDEVDRARDLLVDKSREVETYHRLRGRQQEEHDAAARKEEQKGHDETAVQRYHQLQRDEKSASRK